jgi:hypothetical protein
MPHSRMPICPNVYVIPLPGDAHSHLLKEYISIDDHNIHDKCDGPWESYYCRAEFDNYEKAVACKRTYCKQGECAKALLTLSK